MIERIETERLVMRPITIDDIDLLVELDSDPAVMRFITGGEPSSRARVTERVRASLGHRWVAFERSTRAFVGWFGLVPTDAGDRELGYRMRQVMWGKGYATEGSQALITIAFTELGAQRVAAQTMTVNTRSRAVMERCGLRFVRSFFGDWEAEIDGSEQGDVEYALTKSEWERAWSGAPFAPGSVSLRLYPHLDLDAPEIVAELRAQAALAADHGFDGVMTSEHHGGFAGYLPNPVQAAGFALDAMTTGWAAPCPLLLLLRPPALVIEEIAWLAARHPGRVGLGVAAGALPADFEIMDSTMDDLTSRFARALAEVAGVLGGGHAGLLAGDPAIARLRDHPIPVLSAAGSVTAARRAATNGVGLVFDSLTTPTRCRQLVDAYRAAGGSASCVLIRRAWIGTPPAQETAQQLDAYRSYAPSGAAANWGADEMAVSDDPGEVADRLVGAATVAGVDALNLRVHVPGVAPAAVRAQIERLGTDVLTPLRDALYRGGGNRT